ncbi:MAG: hypothetical protein ABFR75_14175 [Acidobacteriota bacterium]
MKKKSSILIIFFFILFLLLPQIGKLFNIKGEGKNLENRTLASFPEINRNSLFSASFGKKMNEYIWDHFPLRSILLKMDHWIDYHVFRDSPVPEKVILGKKEWLFLSNPIDNLVGKNAEKIDLFKFVFSNTLKAQKKSNIRIIILPSPSKASIYPEFLPEQYKDKHLQEHNIFEKSLNKISSKNKSLLLLWETFRKRKKQLLTKRSSNRIEKRTRYLFQPRDRHFHWETSLLQSKKVIDTIAPGKWKKDMFSSYFSGYKFKESELAKGFLKIRLMEPYKEIYLKEMFKAFNFKIEFKTFSDSKHKYFVFRSDISNKFTPLKKKLVVIHDSFFEQSKFFIAPFFTRSTFLHWRFFKNSKLFMKIVRDADILVIQSVEGRWHLRLFKLNKILKSLKRSRIS